MLEFIADLLEIILECCTFGKSSRGGSTRRVKAVRNRAYEKWLSDYKANGYKLRKKDKK